MTPALSANWTSSVSEPARIFLHDPGSMHCEDLLRVLLFALAEMGWRWRLNTCV